MGRIRTVAGHPALTSAAAVFGTVARVRHARGLHPDGAAWRATLRVAGGGCPGAPLFDEPGEHAGVVRLSRAAGLPEPVPDGLGLALRLPDAHGRGRPQDVLVTSTRPGAVVQHLPVLTGRGFLGTAYSSLVPYRLGGRVRLLGARPADGAAAAHGTGGDLDAARAAAARGELRFELCAATPRGTWWPLGELVLHDELPVAEAEALAFDPLNAGGGIAPCRPLMGIRAAAYAASRAARSGRQKFTPRA